MSGYPLPAEQDTRVEEPIPPFDRRGTYPHPPYASRKDLTREEILALFGYQDIGLPEHHWDCCLSSERHQDCFVINRALRDEPFLASLSPHDKNLFWQLRDLLDSAILKSTLSEDVWVIKGLGDPGWISSLRETANMIDAGYGSFSLFPRIARKYAGFNENNERVFLIRSVPRGTPALYMDAKEQEVLLPRGIRYTIQEIIHSPAGEFLPDDEALVYILTTP